MYNIKVVHFEFFLLTGNELSQNIKYYFFDFQHFVGFRENSKSYSN